MKNYYKLSILATLVMQAVATMPALAIHGEDEAYRSARDAGRAERQQMKANVYASEGRPGKAARAARRARHDQRMAAVHAEKSAYHGYY